MPKPKPKKKKKVWPLRSLRCNADKIRGGVIIIETETWQTGDSTSYAVWVSNAELRRIARKYLDLKGVI